MYQYLQLIVQLVEGHSVSIDCLSVCRLGL